MPAFADYGVPSTELEDTNRILRMLGVPPVNSLTNMRADSDAGLVLQHLRSLLRATASRGWWFNTDRGVEVTPDSGTGFITVENALHVATSNRNPGDDCWPKVRLETAQGSSAGLLRNLDDDTYVFEDPIKVDIVKAPEGGNLPQAFKEYCMYKTARQLAPMFGIQLADTDERLAWDDLTKADAEYSETPNMLTGNPSTADTWMR